MNKETLKFIGTAIVILIANSVFWRAVRKKGSELDKSAKEIDNSLSDMHRRLQKMDDDIVQINKECDETDKIYEECMLNR